MIPAPIVNVPVVESKLQVAELVSFPHFPVVIVSDRSVLIAEVDSLGFVVSALTSCSGPNAIPERIVIPSKAVLYFFIISLSFLIQFINVTPYIDYIRNY